MKWIFHPISREVALADMADLPHRMKARTYVTKRGPEGRHLREQARQQLRWLQLFVTLNRRARS